MEQYMPAKKPENIAKSFQDRFSLNSIHPAERKLIKDVQTAPSQDAVIIKIFEYVQNEPMSPKLADIYHTEDKLKDNLPADHIEDILSSIQSKAEVGTDPLLQDDINLTAYNCQTHDKNRLKYIEDRHKKTTFRADHYNDEEIVDDLILIKHKDDF